MVYISHDFTAVASLCNRVAILHKNFSIAPARALYRPVDPKRRLPRVPEESLALILKSKNGESSLFKEANTP
jgi:hypothetical protein